MPAVKAERAALWGLTFLRRPCLEKIYGPGQGHMGSLLHLKSAASAMTVKMKGLPWPSALYRLFEFCRASYDTQASYD